MKVHYEIFPELKLIVEKVSGVLTIEDLFSKTERLFADEQFDPTYCGVIDLRKAEAEITRVELYGFADFLNKHPSFQHTRWATVVTDPMMTALSELVKQRVIDNASVGIFSSVDGAARFLHQPEIKRHLDPD